MTKDKYYSDFTDSEISTGYARMLAELTVLPNDHKIRSIFYLAWYSFQFDLWSYDGATFVKERYSNTTFEVAAFIHDWRNSEGYVGKWVDDELISIMIALNYPYELMRQRYWRMKFTFVNVWRHKIKKNYRSDKPLLIFII